jgi:hypothetical protein
MDWINGAVGGFVGLAVVAMVCAGLCYLLRSRWPRPVLICGSIGALIGAAVVEAAVFHSLNTAQVWIRVYFLVSWPGSLPFAYFRGGYTLPSLPVAVANGAAYGLACAFVSGGWHWVHQGGFRKQRRLRLLHGLCLYCGYDLQGNVSGKCPECGTAVASDMNETRSSNVKKVSST